MILQQSPHASLEVWDDTKDSIYLQSFDKNVNQLITD